MTFSESDKPKFRARHHAGCLLVALLTSSPPIASAQPLVSPTKGQLALEDFWRGAGGPPRPGQPEGIAPVGAGGANGPRGPGGPPSGVLAAATGFLQPWAGDFYAKFRSAEAAGEQQRTPNNLCLPSTIPGTGVPGGPAYGIEIIVEPKQVTFLYEENRTLRLVYIDQQHPADLKPSWLGHSIGHWEGDVLMVDSVGFNDRNMLVEGMPVTGKLHVVQRLRVVEGRLEDSATFEDAGAFTAPFTVVSRFEHGEPFQEYICAENNKEGGVPTATGASTPYRLPGTGQATEMRGR